MDFTDGDLPAPPMSDHRRLRRMISNRESARRSRMRKQRHLEDLRSRVGRLRIQNQAILNRVSVISGSFVVLRHENEVLVAEAAALQRRLYDIRQFLILRQLSPPPSGFLALSEGISDGKDWILAPFC